MTRAAGDSSYYTFAPLDSHGNPLYDEAFKLPSVTSIIKGVTGDGWGPGSYRGFKLGIRSQHPRMTDERIEELYTKAKRGEWDPNKQLRKAGDRGTRAHWVAESIARGFEVRTFNPGGPNHQTVTVTDPEDPFMDGYCRAAIRWFSEKQPKVIAAEKLLRSLKYGYAGTADLIVQRPEAKTPVYSELVVIIDFKTHAPNKKREGGAYHDDLLQLAAYEQAWDEMEDEAKTYRYAAQGRIVLLLEDGTYQEDDTWMDFDSFKSVLELWKSKQEVMK